MKTLPSETHLSKPNLHKVRSVVINAYMQVTYKNAIPVGHAEIPSPLVPLTTPGLPNTILAEFISCLGVVASKTIMIMMVVPTLMNTKYLVIHAS
jgi:hypothetical protein